MRADALHDLVRAVSDDSPPEHKAIFILWATLDDVAEGASINSEHARETIKRAADALSRTEKT